MSEVAVNVRIEGRVQGVWYRGWTVQVATELGVSGWVRNRRDDSVEAVFSGTQTQIDKIIEKCHSGPSAARVDRVIIKDETGTIEPGFKYLPTL